MFLIGFGGGVLNGATNALAADVSEGERGAQAEPAGSVFRHRGAGHAVHAGAAVADIFALPAIVAGHWAFRASAGALLSGDQLFRRRSSRQRQCRSLEQPGLFKEPVFLFAGLALAVQSGMEGMSNDWMTRYFRKVTLAGEQADEWKNLCSG